ncbi:replication-relaxation family protein [Clostridium sp. ZS2]|uniref:replication-relaxation family protein n=1 Tax=Clostridium sp. ZS2 TaxID=2949988 RepID=UPI002079492E|nr:replication-relaxation family protein [Clostridium sp. ZS2]
MLTSRDREVLTWIESYKAITINQASVLFFNSSYESARRRLKQLEDMQFLKSYLLNTKEKVYYFNKKISKHDLLVYDFIKVVKEHGGELIKLKIQPNYLNRAIRPDAFIIFSYKSMVFFILLEVDLNHYTSNSKMQRYEELYKSGELQKQCYNTFPIIVISRPIEGIRYNSKNFNVIYLDLLYNNISNLLLENSNIV